MGYLGKMKSNYMKDNVASRLRGGETGVKLNGSSVVERELLPFSGSFQPNRSTSFEEIGHLLTCSEQKPPRVAHQNHYDEGVTRR